MRAKNRYDVVFSGVTSIVSAAAAVFFASQSNLDEGSRFSLMYLILVVLLLLIFILSSAYPVLKHKLGRWRRIDSARRRLGPDFKNATSFMEFFLNGGFTLKGVAQNRYVVVDWDEQCDRLKVSAWEGQESFKAAALPPFIARDYGPNPLIASVWPKEEAGLLTRFDRFMSGGRCVETDMLEFNNTYSVTLYDEVSAKKILPTALEQFLVDNRDRIHGIAIYEKGVELMARGRFDYFLSDAGGIVERSRLAVDALNALLG